MNERSEANGETKSLIHRGRSDSGNGEGAPGTKLMRGERRSMSLDSTDSHDSMLTFGTGGEGGLLWWQWPWTW